MLLLGVNKITIFSKNIQQPQHRFSIIVPFRNESKNLPDLLKSVENLDYPKDLFELVLVNDHSTDVYQNIIEEFKNQSRKHVEPILQIRLLQNHRIGNSPKKDAITTAIKANTFEWVFTTDADCILHQDTLKDLNAYIVNYEPNIVAGLVKMKTNSSLIQQFQNWDWNSLLGFTLAGFGWKKPMICSGANLCYRKDVFIQINGFEGNEHIASGDDVFILNKMFDYQPHKVGFIFHPDKAVFTKPLQYWCGLIEQRKRWMSKTGSIDNIWLKLIGIMVWVTNFWFIFSLFCIIIKSANWKYFTLFLIFKMFLDTIYLIMIKRKMNERVNFKSLIISNIIYPFFSIGITILWFFFGFKWKERNFRK